MVDETRVANWTSMPRMRPDIHLALKGRASALPGGRLGHAYALAGFIVLGLSDPAFEVLLRRARTLLEGRAPLPQAVSEIRAIWQAASDADSADGAAGRPARPPSRGPRKKKE